MPNMKYWNGTNWIVLDAADAQTLQGRTPSTFADAGHKHDASDVNSGELNHQRLPIVPVSKGGTGAEDPADARNNLHAASKDHTHTVSSESQPVTGLYEGLIWYRPSRDETRVYLDGGFRSITGGAGGSGGLNNEIITETNTVSVSQTTSTVNHGIDRFDPNAHLLFVYQNSTFLQEGKDYTISADGERIEKASGSWIGGSTEIDFVALKTKAIPTSDVLIVSQLENTYIAGGGETNIAIDMKQFEPQYDTLEVYHNNKRLTKNRQWELVGDDSVDFINNYAINSNDEITFVITKKVRDSVPVGTIDGQFVIDGTINKAKLGRDAKPVRTAGSENFASNAGVTVSHNLGHTDYQVSITPTQNPTGQLGEVWVEKNSNTINIYNSGTATTTFDYIIVVD